MEKSITSTNHQFVKERDYWLNKLAGDLEMCSFPYRNDYPEQVSKKNLKLALSEEVAERLIQLSGGSDQRLHMILVAGVTALLYRYTGIENIIVGSPIYKQEIEGDFVNTVLALKNKVNGQISFKELILSVRETIMEALDHQNYPVQRLIYELNLHSYQESFPLFDVAVLLDSIHAKEYIDHLNLGTILTFIKGEKGFYCQVEYNTRHYSENGLKKIFGHLDNLLKSIVANINTGIAEIEILQETEKNWFFAEKSEQIAYPVKTVQELFEGQVQLTPNEIAVVHEGKEITYFNLNQKANQLAYHLRAKGVQPDDIVGLMIENSIEMIIGILSILKAGGAYLPIAPDYPAYRIEYMLQDCQAKFLLTQSELKDRVEFNGEVICLDQESNYTGAGTDLEIVHSQENLAYVIYTSGTSGLPKGVMIEHRNLVDHLFNYRSFIQSDRSWKVLLMSSFTFDPSVQQIFVPLITGARLYIVAQRVITDPKQLLEFIMNNEINVIDTVPTMMNAVIDYCDQSTRIKLKVLLLGGEVFSKKLYAKLREKCEIDHVYNLYGPTENTIASTWYKCTPTDERETIPIGKPINNCQVYILDNDLNLLPKGVVGELCLAGAGLARGYVNNAKLTAEKFVESTHLPGGKIYRTGDLVRWIDDDSGNLEFLGRKDNQIKIRGYRVETEEISNQLLKHSAIVNAVVLCKKDNNDQKSLYAYFVGEGDLTITELREFLVQNLPDYMIPAHFIQISDMPMTHTGKIDFKVLEQYEQNIAIGVEYIPPRNDIEEKMVETWQDVLGVEKIGINDNFFALGGDSIKMILILARLHNYDLKVEISHLLHAPTIGQLSKFVKTLNLTADQGLVTGEIGLTPIQHWFLDKGLKNPHHVNQAMVLTNEQFDEKFVDQVFTNIVEHHDVLRVIYKQIGDQVVQLNRDLTDKPYTLEVFDLTDLNSYQERIKSEIDKLHCGINISSGPLMKLGLFKTVKQDYFVVIIHHLVVDGVSWRILLDDFVQGYDAVSTGEEIKFNQKTLSFKEWSEQIYQYAESPELMEELKYWQELDNTLVKPMPKDSTGEKMSFVNKSISFSVKETADVLKNINHVYNTEINDILLTVLSLTINEYTGEKNIAITVEGHGREPITEDTILTRTIGWFTTIYPVVLTLKSTELGNQIKEIKETLRNVPQKGIGYGILKYITGKEFTLQPEISFNYLGQFDQQPNSAIQVVETPYLSAEEDSVEHGLTVSGKVIDNVLTITFKYDTSRFSEGTIEKLLALYQDKLRQVIDHCLHIEESELTPSDLTYKDLSIEELDDLIDLMDEL